MVVSKRREVERGLLLQRPVFSLLENGFCTDRPPNLQAGSETRSETGWVWEWSFIDNVRRAQRARSRIDSIESGERRVQSLSTDSLHADTVGKIIGDTF